ncbi:ABC transporter ATP-binding protein [Glaciimonas sp. PCH181]|uniref:ABC transporter ATP-binding protein n=1 Tax=Glaciimonas sp. PCH181 TaxID=2133943 RepID=UPI000D39DCF1|nr:oligopeptide/dipeptide ABC transporter ATP-binding protein [Glaciimonas sp. PCH181]PUA20059.1 hypothetical protein C7W93_09750 [Glaciimonas sp. PCH181]
MTQPLLHLQGVSKKFTTGRQVVHALDSVDLQVARAETLGLVGESGCGKSTLGKAAMQLLPISAGAIAFDGVDLNTVSPNDRLQQRARMQMVFQDPVASLNPRSTVGRILEEPLIVHRRGNASERKELVASTMARVGLRPEMAQRYPDEFSGGQRQRIGIARALMLRPELIICDEAVSALDVSIRAQVLNLLLDLREEFGVSYLFISHDLSVVKHLADRVAVMYLGSVVEQADRQSLWQEPLHPYTRALLAAVPSTNPRLAHKRKHVVLQGDLPSPLHPPGGCKFHPRCPYATDRCKTEAPVLRPISATRLVACHLV